MHDHSSPTLGDHRSRVEQQLSRVWIAICLSIMVLSVTHGSEVRAAEELVLHARVQTQGENQSYTPTDRELRWDPKKTAIVVCDMWNQHWCRGASRRVAEMAPHMNQVIKTARDRGILIVHCPSSCMDAYKDTPMRKLATQAPVIQTKVALQPWCRIDVSHEQPLPIDDADGGCDCWPRCPQGSPWRRQIDTLEIKESDAVTDSAEAFYLMKQRGIENVIVMGVHTNMCVLGRPFSIRQMVYQGQNVVLMRDMTDTMYNPAPDHWCPTCTGLI